MSASPGRTTIAAATVSADSDTPTAAVFVDLDGTLTLTNSYHEFVRCLWRFASHSQRVQLIAILLMRAARSGRLITKRRCISLYATMPAATRDRVVRGVVEGVERSLSAPVLDRVRKYQASGARIVLATAALEPYAAIVARSLAFDDCIATTTELHSKWRENIGDEKRIRCLTWIGQSGTSWPQEVVVISDHADDLPLMAHADVVVVQASKAKFDCIRSALENTAAEHIDPECSEPDGGLWLWIDDGPSGPHDLWEARTILSKFRYSLIYCGEGRWLRAPDTKSLRHGVRRLTSPSPPGVVPRLAIYLRRRIVRRALGIFH